MRPPPQRLRSSRQGWCDLCVNRAFDSVRRGCSSRRMPAGAEARDWFDFLFRSLKAPAPSDVEEKQKQVPVRLRSLTRSSLRAGFRLRLPRLRVAKAGPQTRSAQDDTAGDCSCESSRFCELARRAEPIRWVRRVRRTAISWDRNGCDGRKGVQRAGSDVLTDNV